MSGHRTATNFFLKNCSIRHDLFTELLIKQIYGDLLFEEPFFYPYINIIPFKYFFTILWSGCLPFVGSYQMDRLIFCLFFTRNSSFFSRTKSSVFKPQVSFLPPVKVHRLYFSFREHRKVSFLFKFPHVQPFLIFFYFTRLIVHIQRKVSLMLQLNLQSARQLEEYLFPPQSYSLKLNPFIFSFSF